MGGVEMSERCGERDRIEAIDVRLRAVEGALIDIAATSRMLRIIIAVMRAGLGIDVQGMV